MGFVIMRRCAPQMAAPAEAEQDFERKKSSSNELTSPSTISVTCVCSPRFALCACVAGAGCASVPRHTEARAAEAAWQVCVRRGSELGARPWCVVLR